MLQEKDIPYFYEGVDYSTFPDKLKAYYRTNHIAALKATGEVGTTSVDHHRQKLAELTGLDLYRYILDHHTDLAFHEAVKKGGAKVHLRKIEAIYSRHIVKKVKFVASRPLDITLYAN